MYYVDIYSVFRVPTGYLLCQVSVNRLWIRVVICTGERDV